MKVCREMIIAIVLLVLILQAAVFADTAAAPQEPQKREILGLKITGFVEVSALQSAGAQLGDIIMYYDGVRIGSLDQLLALRDNLQKEKVVVVLRRGKDEVKVNIPKGMLGAYLQEIAVDHPVDDDAVVIEGIGRLGWGLGMDNSFLGCVTLLEEKFGQKLSYQDVLGLSGYGFRTNFFKGPFCGSSADATCGRDIGGEILTRLGYEFAVYTLPDSCITCKEKAGETREHLLRKIMSSIDAGWPVIAIDLIDVAEWGIITGYQKGGKELFCRTYFDKTEGYELAHKLPWTIYAITGKKDIDIGKEYGKSLSIGQELLCAKSYGAYANGMGAVKEWMRLLQDEEYFKSLDANQLYDAMYFNWWTYYSLFEGRRLNAAYLSANRDKFGVGEKEVEELARLMEKESALLDSAFSCVPSTWENADASVWKEDLRKEQVDVLSELLELEGQVAQILKAVRQ